MLVLFIDRREEEEEEEQEEGEEEEEEDEGKKKKKKIFIVCVGEVKLPQINICICSSFLFLFQQI